MSTTTTYTCDLCKASQDTEEQFWNIHLSVDHSGKTSSSYRGTKKIDSCRVCLERLNLLPLTTREATPEDKALTIGEKLESLIMEMVDNGIEWRES